MCHMAPASLSLRSELQTPLSSIAEFFNNNTNCLIFSFSKSLNPINLVHLLQVNISTKWFQIRFLYGGVVFALLFLTVTIGLLLAY